VLLEKKSPDGATEQTRLSEAEYTRNVGGALPRLMMGEERSVSVRAGSVTRDGVETRAAIASLSIQDKKVTAAEQQQLANFATQVGSALAPATAAGGKGTFAVQVALTDENLTKLDGRSADDIKTAFSFAKGSLEGGVAPWMDETPAKVNTHYRHAPQQTVKQEFADGERALDRAGHDDQGARESAIRDYQATTGRDLVADVGSHEAMNEIVEELVKARGKPVSEWGPALSTLGRQSSVDVRTALIALTRLADASMVSLEIAAHGVSLGAKRADAPKSAAQIVGPILTPAGVN
jgi:hypothetical protein